VTKPEEPASILLPWRHVLTLAGACLVLGALFLVVMGRAGAVMAVAGFAVGGFAIVSAGWRDAAPWAAGYLLAFGLLVAWPGIAALALLSTVLCVLAGVEVARTGRQIAVMLLLGLVMSFVAMPGGGGVGLLFPAAAGLAAGFATLGWLGLAGTLPPGPSTARHGWRLGLFLGGGMALSFVLVLGLDLPRAYWIAVLFLSRALIPFPDRAEPLRRYGTGAALGVLVALGIEALALPDGLRLALALAALVLGIRFMLHTRPIGPAMTTVAVLLGTAPTTAEALFRAEAIGLVIGMIVLLGLVIDRLWSLVFEDPDALQGPKTGGNRHRG
jgi:hypothetical protein